MGKNDTKRSEWVIDLIIRISGYSSVLFVTLIFLFLMREGLPALWNVPLSSLFGERWYPIENLFGIWPLLAGSLIVTLGALLLAIPTIFLSMVWYGIYRQRYFWNKTRFETAQFRSTIRFLPLLWIKATNIMLVVFTLGLGKAWATVRYYRYLQDNLLLAGRLNLAGILQQPVKGTPVGDELADYLDINMDLG